MNQMNFNRGIQDGIPIGLGYFAVSFTFGMMAVSGGLTAWQAVLISLTNLTSAGPFLFPRNWKKIFPQVIVWQWLLV